MDKANSTAEIISIAEAKPLTPRQRWLEKLKSDPVKYAEYCENLKVKKREAYHKSREGMEDGRHPELCEGGRICRVCNEPKSWDEFAKDVHGYNQKTATCIPCRNARAREAYRTNPAVRRSGMKNRPDKLLRDYGISSWAEVVRILDAQHGRCANRACGEKISLDVAGARKGRAVIDHDHKTGKFRALLCSRCNTSLGVIEADENLFLGLMDYKRSHGV